MAGVAKKTLKGTFTPVEVRAFVAMFNEQTQTLPIIELFRKSDDELLTIVAELIGSHEVNAESIYLKEIEPRKVAYMQLLHRNPKATFDASAMVVDEEVALVEDEDTEGETEMATPRPVPAPRPAAATPVVATPRAAAPAPAAPAAAAPAPARAVPATPAAATARPAAPATPAARPSVAPAGGVMRPATPATPAAKPVGAVSPAATPAAAVKEPEPPAEARAEYTGPSPADIQNALREALLPVNEKLAEFDARITALQETLEAASSDGSDVEAVAKDVRTILVMQVSDVLRRFGYVDNAETAQMVSSILEADYREPVVVLENLVTAPLYGLDAAGT